MKRFIVLCVMVMLSAYAGGSNMQMLEELKKWPEKLHAGSDCAERFVQEHGGKLPKKIRTLVFAGMGGSGMVGKLAQALLDREGTTQSVVFDTPIVPKWVGKEDFVVAMTYSGNTWETLRVINTCIERSIPFMVMTHNGKAEELAQQQKVPYAILPESVTPRSSLGSSLGFVLVLCDALGLLKGRELVKKYITLAESYTPKMLSAETFSDFITLAKGYSSFHVWGVTGDSTSAAYRGQTQFNENSKVRAVLSPFPELNHNLVVGFTDISDQPLVVLFHTEFLTDDLRASAEIVSELIQKQGANLYKSPVFGDTFGEQLLSLVLWADGASYHLGVAREVDVTSVVLIDTLKKRLQKRGIS